jgi:ABC-2 type transport system permease protein
MLRSVFTKTLREQRWTLLIWSLVLVVVMMVGYDSFNQIDPSQVESLVQNPAFKFLNDPVEVGTPSGLVTFRYGFFFSLLLGIFAVLLGGRLLRAEETRGSLELVLARPRGRRIVLLEKVAASAVILLILGVAYGVGAMLGEVLLDVPVTVAGGLLSGLNLSLLLFVYAMLALALSHYTRSSGAAAGIAGALFGLFFILDGTGRIYPGIHWIRWFSPNYYYDLSKPLITSYGSNVWAMLFLLALGLLLLAASLRLFERRDIGAVVPLPLLGRQAEREGEARTPETIIDETARDRWLRDVLARSLRAAGPALSWWALGIFLYAVYGAGITKSSGDQLRDVFRGSEELNKILGNDLLASNAGLISLFVFLLLNIVVLLYALVRANGWVSDQDNGRLDLLLSTPQPRWKVALQSYGATLIAFVVLALALAVGITIGAVATGLSLSLGKVFGASLALLPPMALVAGAVYALGARFRSNVVLSAVGGYLGLAYFFDLLWAYLGLPGWMHNLSIFSAYGTPVVDGVNWLASLVMFALAALATAVGIYLFQTGDLRQGG